MNKVQKMIMSFAAVALIVSFSAFTSTSNSKLLHTYYPVETSAGQYSWQEINPANYNCVEGEAACDAYQSESATPPTANTIPTGYQADGFVLRAK